jgi:hypothetical protein
VSVGIAGFVGVLSGMVPGAYSATINLAPSDEFPGFDFGPAFLLRKVLEDCVDYDDAVDYLSNTDLAAPVFFTVCGTKRGQACVVERTRTRSAIRQMSGGVLTQANHYVKKFKTNNRFAGDLEYSEERARALLASLGQVRAAEALDEVAAALDVDPVTNEESYQQMAFCPKTGDFRVWRWV